MGGQGPSSVLLEKQDKYYWSTTVLLKSLAAKRDLRAALLFVADPLGARPDFRATKLPFCKVLDLNERKEPLASVSVFDNWSIQRTHESGGRVSVEGVLSPHHKVDYGSRVAIHFYILFIVSTRLVSCTIRATNDLASARHCRNGRGRAIAKPRGWKRPWDTSTRDTTKATCIPMAQQAQ